jgi:restriction system protein
MGSAEDLPKYWELMWPTLRAVDALGGSGSGREITEQVLATEGFADELLEVTYEKRPTVSVLLDRMDWARSYLKLGGAIESPKRSLFQITARGREIVDLPHETAVEALREMDREVRRERVRANASSESPELVEEGSSDLGESGWRGDLLTQLHALSPEAFEEYVLLVLRNFGLELERIGGSGDEGIDGIGRAPLTAVLSTRVAVQAKRYEPSKVIGREVVALFQRDAAAVGAERAILVTTAQFSKPARMAAVVTTPNVDLIDGEALCDLALEAQAGVREQPVVHIEWFSRFSKP